MKGRAFIFNDSAEEKSKEHSNLTEVDFSRIPEIISSPDEILAGGKSNLGLDVVKYKKAFNGTTYYLEEIRKGNKVLGMKTMYKTKTPPRASSAQ